jgi:hypothetical protein
MSCWIKFTLSQSGDFYVTALYVDIKRKICRSILLSVALYRCEIWSLPIRKEHRLRVLRKVFGPKREEVTGDWKKA